MEAAIFGLAGTILGGAITVVMAIIKFRQEVKIWAEQFDRQSQKEMGKLRLERYSNFLGAYYYIEGGIQDLIDIMEQGGKDVGSRLSLVVSNPAFEKSVAAINDEKGWIALLSSNRELIDQINRLERVHDDIFSIAAKVRCGEKSLEQVIEDIKKKQQTELTPLASSVIDLMRQDAGVRDLPRLRNDGGGVVMPGRSGPRESRMFPFGGRRNAVRRTGRL